MIVNEDCLHTLAELTIDRLIADGIQSAWSGDYQINLLKGNIDILIDVGFAELGEYGATLTLTYKKETKLAVIKIKDCRMFGRTHMEMEFSAWREATTALLVRNYSRWLAHIFVQTDQYIRNWFDNLQSRDIPSSMTISGYLFKANLRLNAAWFQVEHEKVIVYRIERSNYLNMTTEQGWQALGGVGMIAELVRVIATLISTRAEFKIPVSL